MNLSTPVHTCPHLFGHLEKVPVCEVRHLVEPKHPVTTWWGATSKGYRHVLDAWVWKDGVRREGYHQARRRTEEQQGEEE